MKLHHVLIGFLLCGGALPAQQSPLFGNWKEPSGSILHIESCGSGICLRLISLSPQSPSTVDFHNPDAAQRNRPLCGLQVGTGFHLTDASSANGGTLYDPKSGHTYHGTMTLANGQLRLRGYIGSPIFGRSETWQRFDGATPPCAHSTGS